jgi:uncharacterized repeat protein (TIGR01451 family)
MSKPRRLGTSALLAFALVGVLTPPAQAADPAPVITGTVFSDRNGDGVFDPTEGDTPISGVQIEASVLNTDPGGGIPGGRLSAQAPGITTTDENGAFAFTDLSPAVYTVTENQPNDFDDGVDTAGTGTVVSGNDEFIADVTGSSSATATFAEVPTSALSGLAYRDDDNDGDLDLGETGIASVPVALRGTDSDGHEVSFDTTTNAWGEFSFSYLRAGTYSLTETQPSGFIDGKDTPGVAGGVRSAPDAITTITLPARSNGTGYLFGELAAASISGNVSVTNGGGPIPSTGMFLTGTDYADNPVSKLIYTDGAGDYTFGDLAPGTYTVREGQPFGYGDGDDFVGTAGGQLLVNDEVSGIVLTVGQTATGYDFLDTVGSLSGLVYLDSNGNDAYDSGDEPIGDVPVRLTGTDVYDNAVDREVHTHHNGEFSFAAVLKGTYTLTETQPDAYADGPDTAGTSGGTPTSPDSITDIVFAPGDTATGYQFGERATPIDGTVFLDHDADGVRDADDTAGIDGVTVVLENTSGQEITRRVTGSDGGFSFPALAGGDYVVRELQPNGYGSTTPNTVPVQLAAGEPGGILFGDDLGLVGGRVWSDIDKDGTQDPGEPGVAGVTATLVPQNPVARAPLREQTTGADGSYAFGDLPEGTYVVRLTLPTGTSLTSQGKPGDDVNSDFHPLTRESGPVTVEVVGDDITRADAVDAGLLAGTRDLTGAVAVDNPNPAPGDRVRITSTVTNTGTVPLAGASARLTVPSGLRLVSYSGASWTCTMAALTLSCTTDTVLQPGDAAPPLVAVATTTSTVDTSAITLTVLLRDGTADDDPTNDTATATVESPQAEPAAPPAPQATVAADPLASTGARVTPELLLAALLLAVGVLTRVAGRRRRM